MKMFKSIVAVIAAVAAFSSLAGCGSTPGDSEVRAALKGRIVSSYLTMFPGKQLTAKDTQELDDALGKVKVAGCKKSETNEGFNCDWSGPELITKIGGVSGRIFKGESGWSLVKAGD